MKKLLTLALAGVALAVLNGVGVAQEARQAQEPQRPQVLDRPDARDEEDGQLGVDDDAGQVPCPKLTQVKVLEVNESAKTITVVPEGKTFTFDARNLKSLPKLGEIIRMWVLPTGEPDQILVCVSCQCPPSGAAGPCNVCCFNYEFL